MKVLLLESYPGSGRVATEELERAGHQIVRCDSAGHEAPCRGLDVGGACPLDGDDVSVAVVATAGGELQPGEHGALCASRQRIPLVTTASVPEPGVFESIAAPAGNDLIAACEAAAAAGDRHEAAVRRDLVALGTLDAVDLEGEPPAVGVTVRRAPGRLVMRLRIAEGDRREPAIVKGATEALRRYDRRVSVIDVSVER